MILDRLQQLELGIRSCKLCASRFAKTATEHSPSPVFWCSKPARLLITGQAPGAKVHSSGMFFSDASGNRLRSWLGMTEKQFYDRSRVAILPMAFCFPGYSNKGSDLPPPKICAETWRESVLSELPEVSTTLLIGSYAQKWHIPNAPSSVRDTVENWRFWAPEFIPLPHPSWRNNAMLSRIAGFESELLPYLRQRIRSLLDD